MFDIGFAELLIIATIALLVLGPERLPGAIKTGTLWLGRFRRGFNDIKRELEQEIGADEIKQQLHNEAILKELAATKEEAQASLKKLHDNMDEVTKSLQSDLEDTPAKPK